MDAGKRNALLIFQKRGDDDDGFGTVTPGVGPWAEVFRRYGNKTSKAGTTPVVGGGQIGLHPVIIKVRADPETLTIDNTFQIVDAGSPQIPLNILSAVDEKGDGMDITITAIAGGLS